MPDQPFPLTAKDVSSLIQQMKLLLDDLYQGRVAGALLGDVFRLDSNDVLTASLSDSGGLEKSDGEIVIKIKDTGGMQTSSDGLSIKCKVGGGLATDVDGLYASGLAVNSFQTIDCPSGTDPVASTSADKLNLSAGYGLTITGDSGTKTVTFAFKRQAHLADAAAVSAIACGSGTDSIDLAAFNTSLGTLVTEINAIKTVLNTLLSRLETAEVLASS